MRCHVATINNGKQRTERKTFNHIHTISWMENSRQITKRMALLLSIWTICVKRSKDIRHFKELPNNINNLLNQTRFHKAPIIN